MAVGLAAHSSFLALIAGISRTVFAMARERDLPLTSLALTAAVLAVSEAFRLVRQILLIIGQL